MKRPFKALALGIMLAASCIPAFAADCDYPVGVAAKESNADIPQSVYSTLTKRVESMLGDKNLVSTDADASFMILADIIDVNTAVLPGPPRQNTANLTVLLQLLDTASGNVISSCTLEGLKGVGNSMQQAYSNSLRSLNAKNPRCSEFLAGVSQKISNYYEKNYPLIIAKAKTKAGVHEYEEALFRLFSIPECCSGYAEASNLALQIYQEYIDTAGMKAFQAARALWIASQDAEGASKALTVLLTIPSGSAAGVEAEKLMDEIYATVKDDKAFETREKYKDTVRLEELKTQAAKEIGEAWGKGQQPSTNNILIK